MPWGQPHEPSPSALLVRAQELVRRGDVLAAAVEQYLAASTTGARDRLIDRVDGDGRRRPVALTKFGGG